MAKRSRDDTLQCLEHGIDISTRTILLCEEINVETAKKLIANLHILTNSYEPTKNITILLNCDGGDITHGFAIYDAIRKAAQTCDIHIEAFGQVASMGVIVLQAATHRSAHENVEFMTHDGSTDYPNGHVRDLERYAAQQIRIRKQMYKLLEKHTGMAADTWDSLNAFDTFMTAQEACDCGLIDEVIKYD